MDCLIKNGTVVDGSGSPSYRANIGIKGDEIAYIGNEKPEASQNVDAQGLTISPGFIDIHTHADFNLFLDPTTPHELHQGVTTVIVGNCGFSAGPVRPSRERTVREAISTLLPEIQEISWNVTSVKEYLKRIGQAGVSVNVGTLVGHNTLRLNTLGTDRREPTKDELDEMKALLQGALMDGALGFSSGLIYIPGIFAKTNELIELCKVAGNFRVPYISHIRGEAGTLLKAVEEAIEIARQSRIALHVSHHKASGRNNWGKVAQTLEMLKQAKKIGIDVSCDVYPYRAGSTTLATLIPPWVFSKGPSTVKTGFETMRSQIIDSMLTANDIEERPLVEIGAENIMVTFCRGAQDLEGKTLEEISQGRRTTPAEAVIELYETYHDVQIALFEMAENDVTTVIRDPLSMIASDSYGVPGRGKPHPRLYGTFSRVLAKYVRDERVLSVEEAIKKMASMPAWRLGLNDRGVIEVGRKADLAIFDMSSVADRGTFSNPCQFSEGIKYVFVNGKLALREGAVTGVRAGTVVTHSPTSPS